jgi:hypothetical protein
MRDVVMVTPSRHCCYCRKKPVEGFQVAMRRGASCDAANA